MIEKATLPFFFYDSDYKDPNQGLCSGALVDIAATTVSNTCPIVLGSSLNFMVPILYAYMRSGHYRHFIWGEGFVSLGFADRLRG